MIGRDETNEVRGSDSSLKGQLVFLAMVWVLVNAGWILGDAARGGS